MGESSPMYVVYEGSLPAFCRVHSIRLGNVSLFLSLNALEPQRFTVKLANLVCTEFKMCA